MLSTKPEIATERRIPEIEQQLLILQDHTVRLNETFNLLKERLNAARSCQVRSELEKNAKPEVALCPLADALRSSNNALLDLDQRLTALRNEIEL